jgi:type IV pilus assembly protein PilF
MLLVLAACAQAPAPQGGEAPAQSGESYRARIHTELAAQYYARRQYSVALQELREALRSEAGYAPAYNMLALVHTDLGEFREAEEAYRRAIDLQPQYSEAYNNFGYFLCQRGRLDESLGQFEKAWRNPLYASPEKALANAGYCTLLKGDPDEAERLAQRAMVRAPNQPVAILTLAEVSHQRGHIQLARSQVQQLAGLGPLDAAALWLGVRIERQLGNRAAEGDHGAQLRRRFPDARETRWLLSGQYDKWGGNP